VGQVGQLQVEEQPVQVEEQILLEEQVVDQVVLTLSTPLSRRG
tara:strand:+ start:262 stop:390 length:129 start_codon:yes stop_codon:yes gene_type:complete